MEKIRQDIKDFFVGLTFEEKSHRYSVGGILIEKSVSTLIKKFYIPFNDEEKSKAMSERDGTLQQDLLDKWRAHRDERINIGKQTHLFGELYAFNRNLRPQSKYDLGIMKFWNELPDYIIPIVVELPMYHKEKMYAGTPDAILLNTLTGKLVLIDYKSNVDIFKNFAGQKMIGCFSNLLDCPYNKYQVQLSYYKILLEQTGYEVSTTKIIWITDNGSYRIYDTEDLTQYIK